MGRFEAYPASGDVLAYFGAAREGDASFLVALNLGSRPHTLAGTDETDGASVIVRTRHKREGEKIHGELVLGPMKAWCCVSLPRAISQRQLRLEKNSTCEEE